MNADPLIAHETQPTRTLAAMVRADERLTKEFPFITLPVLILYGTADKDDETEREPVPLRDGRLERPDAESLRGTPMIGSTTSARTL
jgi:hypothetical protein